MSAALATLLLCQLAGEILVRALHLPVPRPVLGMALLVASLVLRGRAPPPALGAAADALLGNLGLLFVPAGAGVMLYRHALRNVFHRAPPLGTATGRLAQALLRRLG
ncbi:CidA/LrgA family protein [Roseicella sp. DB1501]|uniref:CidA/LrgA family protein n=1 Tax=Roseicella sp. DB1501 TaxID=2730925 RepID=UPI0014922F9D|nr:CidA/LrgA family protein [Roseicella sp. DB1501]NOG72608.1 CidA/LrgA family protein [Roseicella sp. DB1501]